MYIYITNKGRKNMTCKKDAKSQRQQKRISDVEKSWVAIIKQKKWAEQQKRKADINIEMKKQN